MTWGKKLLKTNSLRWWWWWWWWWWFLPLPRRCWTSNELGSIQHSFISHARFGLRFFNNTLKGVSNKGFFDCDGVCFSLFLQYPKTKSYYLHHYWVLWAVTPPDSKLDHWHVTYLCIHQNDNNLWDNNFFDKCSEQNNCYKYEIGHKILIINENRPLKK